MRRGARSRSAPHGTPRRRTRRQRGGHDRYAPAPPAPPTPARALGWGPSRRTTGGQDRPRGSSGAGWGAGRDMLSAPDREGERTVSVGSGRGTGRVGSPSCELDRVMEVDEHGIRSEGAGWPDRFEPGGRGRGPVRLALTREPAVSPAELHGRPDRGRNGPQLREQAGLPRDQGAHHPQPLHRRGRARRSWRSSMESSSRREDGGSVLGSTSGLRFGPVAVFHAWCSSGDGARAAAVSIRLSARSLGVRVASARGGLPNHQVRLESRRDQSRNGAHTGEDVEAAAGSRSTSRSWAGTRRCSRPAVVFGAQPRHRDDPECCRRPRR